MENGGRNKSMKREKSRESVETTRNMGNKKRGE